MNGSMIGLFYILTVYLLSSLVGNGFELNPYAIIMIIASIVAGAIGGVVGVNLK